MAIQALIAMKDAASNHTLIHSLKQRVSTELMMIVEALQRASAGAITGNTLKLIGQIVIVKKTNTMSKCLLKRCAQKYHQAVAYHYVHGIKKPCVIALRSSAIARILLRFILGTGKLIIGVLLILSLLGFAIALAGLIYFMS